MKIRIARLGVLMLAFSALPARAQTNPSPQTVAIKAGKLLDPETGKTTVNQVILVEGKIIKQIGGKSGT